MTRGEHTHTNRLSGETSPYLLQHQHNPVDWYPWGDEAIQKAKSENKPIFLSIGYAACHWCHVMERESFENEEVAKILNEHFVSIKVDREERPDLDDIYMTAVQMMTGQGGWPMSVFLTPDLRPFYGGTYYPPNDMYGRPGFKSVLRSLYHAWNEQRESIDKSADELTGLIRKHGGGMTAGDDAITDELLSGAAKALKSTYDLDNGGWGGAPKFPSAPSIALLLRMYRNTGEEAMLGMATETLINMAHGGMYDQLGGGFHRYSVDEHWLVPHFEKMLYDNGQLVPVYLEAYQLTGNAGFARIAREILEYQLRDMTHPEGPFYATEDADSEGEEGKFYIWTYQEIVEALGDDDAKIFSAYYNVKPDGNFHSHENYHIRQNILHITRTPAEVAAEFSMTEEALEARMAPMREKLMQIRGRRVRPGLDDKIITAWNGLMIGAMAQAARVLDEPRYAKAAENAAAFILTKMRSDGMVLRTHRNGESRHLGCLDDHMNLAAALVDLYEATFDFAWLREAEEMADIAIREFWDNEAGGFFYTSSKQTDLIARQKPTYDGSEPSGNSTAALVLLRLAKLADRPEFYEKAEQTIRMNLEGLRKHPQAFLKMLVAVDFYLHPPKEVAIVGAPGSESADALLRTVFSKFVPNKVVAFKNPQGATPDDQVVPLLAGKELVEGEAAAYVCENFACQQPVTKPEELLALLEQA